MDSKRMVWGFENRANFLSESAPVFAWLGIWRREQPGAERGQYFCYEGIRRTAFWYLGPISHHLHSPSSEPSTDDVHPPFFEQTRV
jgi:hypothetical protein